MPLETAPPRSPDHRDPLLRASDAAVGSGIAVADVSGQTIRVNDALCRMVGWSRDELLGKCPPFPYWPEDERVHIEAACRLTLEGLFPRDGVALVFQRRTGERFPVLMYAEPLLLAADVKGWVYNIIDLSRHEGQASALRKSEERLRFALSAANGGWFDLNLQTGKAIVSPEYSRLLGYEPGEYQAGTQVWLDSIHPEDRPDVEAVFKAVLAHGVDIEVTYRRRVRSGDWLWFNSVGRIVEWNGDGIPVRMTGIHVDITDRKQAEVELRDFKAIVDSSDDAIIGKTLEGVIRSWNLGAERTFGYTAEDAIGQSMLMLIPPGRSSEEPEILKRIARGERVESFETVRRRKDGRLVHILATISPVYDGHGKVCGASNIARDITERKQAEHDIRELNAKLETRVAERTGELAATTESLRNSNEQLRTIFDTATVGVLLMRDRSVQQCNRRFEELTGYGPGELIGQPNRILYADPAEWAVAGRDAYELFPQGKPYVSEILARRKDGSTFLALMANRAVDPLDLGRGVVCIVEDITERKAAEVELINAKEAAEAANRAKSTFLANMSHELRTPLNAIIGMAFLLKRAGLTPPQVERLDKIDAAGWHLLGIIDTILDLSKIEAGKLELVEAETDLSRIASEVVALLADRARAKGLRLAVELPASLPPLLADPARLRQALLNYAANAVKFTETGGVTLRARIEDETGTSVLLRFEVQDTGIGIAPESLPRLFTAFEQADNSPTRQYGGTGLGLAITKQLAGLMGGEAGVSSSPGVGSTFWFTARLKKAADVTAATSPAPAGSAEALLRRECLGRRILLAEDDPINRDMVVELVRLAGLDVDTATDGVETVELAGRGRYDLVLMDMQMPRMNGLEATRRLRQLTGWTNLPVLALTANVFASDRAACVEAGMNDFIAKPIDPTSLFEMLLKWLRRPS